MRRLRPVCETACGHRQAGFTLVELLVATSLMAIVAGVCVAALAGGISVWQRMLDFGTKEQSVLIAFEQMQRDLQNVRRFSPVPADGTSSRYTFAAVDRIDPEAPAELGRVGYFVDYRQRLLCRSFVPYRTMRRLRHRDDCEPVLEGVRRIRLSYFVAGGDGEKGDWMSSWDAINPPDAVRVTLTLGEEGGQTHTRSFVVSIMSAHAPEVEDDS